MKQRSMEYQRWIHFQAIQMFIPDSIQLTMVKSIWVPSIIQNQNMSFISQLSLKDQLNRVRNICYIIIFRETMYWTILFFFPQTVVNSYEPIENNDSTVVSAAEYNENNGYSYKKPEGF